MRNFIKTFENFNNMDVIVNNKVWIYLDDLRTPTDTKWIVVRNFQQFKDEVDKHNPADIERISFDHDLADFYIDDSGYEAEWTGYDAIKWFVYAKHIDSGAKSFPIITVHSDNNVGSENIVQFVNNYIKQLDFAVTQCVRAKPDFTV
jgi:hypothetical protein